MTGHSTRVSQVPRVMTLRRRALDAARSRLEEAGPDGLQLRGLASAIGCGTSSLYYHFENKDALLAAVAIEGFQDLRTQIIRTMESGKFARRIEAASAAYLGFMQKHLRLYALMYSESILANDPDVRAAEQKTFQSFQTALIGDAVISETHAEDVSLMFWALGRGIASIILTQGTLDRGQAIETAKKILNGYLYLRTSPAGPDGSGAGRG